MTTVPRSSARGPRDETRRSALWIAIGTGVALALALALPAAAADSGRTLRVSVDKAEVVALGGQAAVVLVANPAIADVVLERNNLLFVLGKRPGETRLFVYSAAGKPMLEREIVVVPNGERTVTIVRDTQASQYSCDPRCVTLSGGGSPAPAPAPAPSKAP
jgi:Flp pilus assembly secretin CpaC